VVVVALVAAGCGGGGKDKVAEPVAEALAHVPRDAALVVVGATDFDEGQGAAARDLLERFPGSEFAVERLKALVAKRGLEFDRDVAPLLGNDVVLAIPDVAPSRGAGTPDKAAHPFLAAGVAPDEEKLDRAIDAAVKRRALRKGTSHRGADLYTRAGHGALAVKGAVAVLGNDTRTVRAALDRRALGAGLTPAVMRTRLAGVPGAATGADAPDEALLRIFGDFRPLLAHRHAARIRRVPWAASLRRFAATVTATRDGVQLRFRADNEGALQESQHPLPLGAAAPSPTGDAPIVVGVRDLAHVIEFAQQVASAVAPGQLQRFATAKTVIKFARGIDLDEDVFGQFTGTTTIRSDLRSVSIRARLRDPKAMRKTLDSLRILMPSFLHGAGIRGASVDETSGGRFVVERDGEEIAAYGLDGDALVVTTDRTEEIAAPGATKPSPGVPKGPGALVGRVSPKALQDLVIRVLGLPPVARVALGALGDATFAIRAERQHIEGRADLKISG
jgi:hypothetical protein